VHSPEDYRAKSYDVFVSYKREDDEARAELVKGLEAAGYEVFWDGKLNHDDWKSELRDEINRSKMVICLWSAKAAASNNVFAEASHAFGIEKLLSAPIGDKSVVPDYFKNTNLHPFDGWADESRRGAQIAKILATLERETGGPIGKKKAPEAAIAIPVEFGDIPGAPPRLVGRDRELAMLKAAWESRAPKKINAVVLHALGGAGKSALLRTFTNELLAGGGGGARRIYGWSAYSQGPGEQKRADADSFISKALGDLGFQGELPKDPVERARALARCIQRERVLLLLDGLEPLQDPPGVNKGRFKDKGLAELVKVLASSNPGLVVLTTRQEVPELEGLGPLVINHPLDLLSDTAGADLLVELGVHGRQRELEAAVRSIKGHALSVTLLGTYLVEVCGGDIRHRDQFDFANIVLSQAEQEELATDKTIIPAKRVAKVMRGYLEQFDKLARSDAAAGLGGPERALLNLLGLFDRPADGKAVAALLEKRIPGLTDELFVEAMVTRNGLFGFGRKIEVRELSADERDKRIRRAKDRLRKLRLLSKPNPNDPQELDAHPIVRAFFSGWLGETAPEAAKTAHGILYRHYSAAAPDLPDTLEEMQPLFHAVQHGVKAGELLDAYHQVFGRRIRRGEEGYIFRMLGAFGPALAVQANFFDAPWRTPRRELSAHGQAWLLNLAAMALTALGRLADSVEPRRAALDAYVVDNWWAMAANVSGGLSDTLLKLGRVAEAVSTATAAVRHADLSGNQNQRGWRRTDLAAALTGAGDLDRAAALFAEAEGIQADAPNASPLFSRQDYRHGDLTLARGDAADALVRGHYQLDIAEQFLGQGMGLHNIGLGHLLIGRAEDALGLPEAMKSLDAAVAGLRECGMTDLLPRALLARASHRRGRAAAGEKDLIEVIFADLAEVEDIAGTEMKLYLTDLALESAHLALDVPSGFDSPAAARAKAEVQAAKAADLIAETGYHCRDGELAVLRARLVDA
jgi:tetratricopeptide (TPR) repeat protein